MGKPPYPEDPGFGFQCKTRPLHWTPRELVGGLNTRLFEGPKSIELDPLGSADSPSFEDPTPQRNWDGVVEPSLYTPFLASHEMPGPPTRFWWLRKTQVATSKRFVLQVDQPPQSHTKPWWQKYGSTVLAYNIISYMYIQTYYMGMAQNETAGANRRFCSMMSMFPLTRVDCSTVFLSHSPMCHSPHNFICPIFRGHRQ